MHIADGIIPNAWCGAAHGVAWVGVYGFGRKVQTEEIVRMGLLASAVFVISQVHFPLGGTSVHLGLYGLAGILLGWRAFPVIFAALLFQTLLFQHGGLLSLGLNALNMGVGALLASLLWRMPLLAAKGGAALRRASIADVPVGSAGDYSTGGDAFKAFLCGFVGIFAPALLLAMEFSFVGYGRGFYFIAMLYLGAAAIEGALTAVAVGFLRRAKPAVFG